MAANSTIRAEAVEGLGVARWRSNKYLNNSHYPADSGRLGHGAVACPFQQKGVPRVFPQHPFCLVRPDDVSRETLQEHRRPDYFFPARSITAATIARAPSVTLSRGAIWNRGEWCPAIGGPPALAAAIRSGVVPPTAK